ncbi:unnamed protein product, partial [Nesidiocoris tenuis]
MKSKSAVDRLYIFMQRCFFKLERAPGRERWFLQRADAIEWWIKNEKGEEKSAIRGSAAEKNAENHLRIKIWKYCVLSMHHWFQQGMCYRRYLRRSNTLRLHLRRYSWTCSIFKLRNLSCQSLVSSVVLKSLAHEYSVQKMARRWGN